VPPSNLCLPSPSGAALKPWHCRDTVAYACMQQPDGVPLCDSRACLPVAMHSLQRSEQSSHVATYSMQQQMF
jgi:hypothetical protein